MNARMLEEALQHVDTAETIEQIRAAATALRAALEAPEDPPHTFDEEGDVVFIPSARQAGKATVMMQREALYSDGERKIRQDLRELIERHRLEAKPLVDALVQMESLRPSPAYFIPAETVHTYADVAAVSAEICGNCGEIKPLGCGGLFADDGPACAYHRKQRGRIDMFIVIPLVVLVFLLTCVVAIAIRADNEWSLFSDTHACKVVGKMSGDVVVTSGANGQVSIGSTSGKTGYLCDDGVTYWR